MTKEHSTYGFETPDGVGYSIDLVTRTILFKYRGAYHSNLKSAPESVKIMVGNALKEDGIYYDINTGRVTSGLEEVWEDEELSNDEISRQDMVDNAIYDLICDLNPAPSGEKILWDIEVIGRIRDVLSDCYVSLGLCTEKEFYPYIEWTDEEQGILNSKYQCCTCESFFDKPSWGNSPEDKICPHCGSGNYVKVCIDNSVVCPECGNKNLEESDAYGNLWCPKCKWEEGQIP